MKASVPQAIAALRSGRAVRIAGANPTAIAAVETATESFLALADPDSSARLLISGERAEALALANRREAANGDLAHADHQGLAEADDVTPLLRELG